METRRDLLRQASIALALPLVLGCRAGSSAQTTNNEVLAAIRKNAIHDPRWDWWGAADVPDNVSNKSVLKSDPEKAQRILVNGTIYQADGRTPASNILIYFYHTNVYGIYGLGSEHKHGKYRGWLLTGADGRYQIETIMPASYPNSTQSAHIHMTLTGTTFKEDWIDSVLFEGDRFLTDRERIPQRGGFDHVLKMSSGPGGILKGTRNIRLAA